MTWQCHRSDITMQPTVGGTVMEFVDEWTGRHARVLRRALRLTNEGFAEHLGTAVRTVARWNTAPDVVPIPEVQQALDTALRRADDQAKARFAALLTQTEPLDAAPEPAGVPVPRTPSPDLVAEAERRLSGDTQYGAALEWLDRHAGWAPGRARRQVAEVMSGLDPRELQDRGHQRARVNREDIADALATYYADLPDGFRTYQARAAGRSVATSLLTRPEWLDVGANLATDAEHFTLTRAVDDEGPDLDDLAASAAVRRVAEAFATSTRLVNAPLYRLTSVDISPGRITGSMAMARFVEYALTMDLLESELADAAAAARPTTPGVLPLRDRYLPDATTVLDVGHRLCAGGPLALLAIARPAPRPGRRPDYLFLIQERSGRVLNAARRLAVIPKSFHGPLVDYGDDARVSASLERELEEELFGRPEVDSVLDGPRHADPMHRSRLSAPMGWLAERVGGETWRMECTGFGLNLVSGNFEFASLIVIDDEEWWDRFGGQIEANWESDGLRRYSSLDRDLLTELIHDPSWSNEGLFALLQGFRRLALTGGDRVDLPTIDWETT